MTQLDPDQPSEAPGIFKGAPVVVKGLKSTPELNGCKGTVSSELQGSGRYEVTLSVVPKGQLQQQTRTLALKPANFRLDVDTLKECILKAGVDQFTRAPSLENLSVLWAKGKGLSSKSITVESSTVDELQQGEILLHIDNFGFSQMSLGYLMKGFTRSFSAYHSFFPYGQQVEREPSDVSTTSKRSPSFYRSGCWGYASVVESKHSKVTVGTRLYGFFPPCRYMVKAVGGMIPPGRIGGPPQVSLISEELPFSLQRFLEYEVVETGSAESEDPSWEDWRVATKEIYTMAFYMDEQLLVDCGMINCVILSCASAKTALALAYCLRMRGLREVIGLTSTAHAEFVRSTDLYHTVLRYDEVHLLPDEKTAAYIDFRCDGELRQAISLRMGTHLMYNLLIGPAVFQKKAKEQVFETRAREIIFDESSWRERRRMVAEVTKTGRNEMLGCSYRAFVERMKHHIKLQRVSTVDAFLKMYDSVFSGEALPSNAYVCSFRDERNDGEIDEIWKDQ